jgi:hypothetical protein
MVVEVVDAVNLPGVLSRCAALAEVSDRSAQAGSPRIQTTSATFCQACC